MATAFCDQLSGTQGLGTANAGISGAPNKARSSDVARSRRRFTFTIPASGAGSAAGDVIIIGANLVTDHFMACVLLIPTGGMGSANTMSIGKIDSNNSANTDAIHYLAVTATTSAGQLNANLNIGEEMGTDPTGAVTDTGNAIQAGSPAGGFGNGPIFLTLTIGGTPTAAKVISGYYDCLAGGN